MAATRQRSAPRLTERDWNIPRVLPPVWHPRRRRINRIALAVAVLAALAAGAVLGARARGGGEEAPAVVAAPAPPPPAGAPLVAGGEAVRLGHPADWVEVDATALPLDLELTGSVQLAPEGMPATDVGLVAGIVEGADAARRPAGLGAADGADAGRRAVAVGDVQAFLHEGVARAGERVVVRAVPTSDGAAYAVCWAGEVFGDFLPACTEIARTLQLTRGRAVPVGLDARDRAAVRTALRGLEVIRTAGRVDLRGAATRAEQAAVAERLADAHRTAAAAIGADGRRDPTTALVAELRGLGGAYDELARAAQRGDRAGFARARRAVAEREARAGRELDELRALPTFRSG